VDDAGDGGYNCGYAESHGKDVMADQWYYAKSGQQHGPVTAEELRAMAAQGALSPQDMVWAQSLPQWEPAGRVAELGISATEQSGVGGSPLAYEAPGAEAQVTPRSIDLLRQTRPWVLFMAILTFIAAGFMVIAGVVLFFIGAAASQGRQGPGPVLGVLYLVLAAMYVFPAVYLTRYAARISDLVRMRRAIDLEAALEAQKMFWKSVGIMVIVGIGLYLLFIVVLVFVMRGLR